MAIQEAPMKGVKIKVWGDYALFTRPENKAERMSYDVPTPSAARGILESIHWKPAIRWVIDRIHVLNPIVFASVRRNEVSQKGPTPSTVKAPPKTGQLWFSSSKICVSNVHLWFYAMWRTSSRRTLK